MRNIWSRNIKDIYDLKNDFRTGLDLRKRSGKHKKPHERPEVKILLQVYSSAELHKRRPGRTYKDGRDVNDFQCGTTHLRGGALRKWATRTSKARITHLHSNVTDVDDNLEHESDWSDDSEDEETQPMTPGEMVYKDGGVVINMEGVSDSEDDEIVFPAVLGMGRSESDEEWE
jgi:hypothetical protein